MMAVNELPDREQLEIVLDGALEHSDFTIYGGYGDRLRERLDAIEEADGRITAETALTVITNRDQFAAIASKYHPWPFWLETLATGLITGRYELPGGQYRNPEWAKGYDVLGLFTELTERFGFGKTLVYQAIAERLHVDGWDVPCKTTSTTTGAETVRQHITKARNALKPSK